MSCISLLTDQINITSDILEVTSCLDILPDDRRDWERLCVGMDPTRKNHRIIRDGEGSDTVYNGHEFRTDLKYTRANRYISGNDL
jgi:hypothetical protein